MKRKCNLCGLCISAAALVLLLVWCDTADAQRRTRSVMPRFEYLDEGPGLTTIMDSEGHYRFVMPLGSDDRRSDVWYEFGDSRGRRDRMVMDLGTDTRDSSDED